MANPEQPEDKPVSKPETASNVSVQDGAEKVYERSGVGGKNTVLLTTLVLIVIAEALVWHYLF